MDQAALVDRQLDDVPRLIDELRRDQFDVKTAFWLYRSEADQWYLYLASDIVDQKGPLEAYKALRRSRSRLTDLRIGPFDVKLVGPDDPIAKAVMDFQSISPAPRPTRVRGANLGNVYIEDAYIY
jgi:hypothetical protein